MSKTYKMKGRFVGYERKDTPEQSSQPGEFGGYTIYIEPNSAEGGWIGRAPAFPDVTVFADTKEEATEELTAVIKGLVDLAKEMGHTPPAKDCPKAGASEASQCASEAASKASDKAIKDCEHENLGLAEHNNLDTGASEASQAEQTLGERHSAEALATLLGECEHEWSTDSINSTPGFIGCKKCPEHGPIETRNGRILPPPVPPE